ncbi:MAG: hypothetical protein A3A61_02225 [Candidatus Woykebacteria bacterium RIFCSPLOWO2_01_FULL_43_14]|uniref:Glycosyl transferase family 1 domain-containing protein n=2 Tax=Candidatus Woykeibacteriota TaxID=1817899 RepID=A0A1G1WVR3_9BACT|nr:MAG: hypothetical protein A3J50_00740 [Candidatus Woykebacteria bacterium RIFCSPHIGHO2_02_FULL_43_16b]OGY31793.1 MAG: hypothetical protein A3A61_02225 [Candidatus Woykebacteria bacterium RIFCSPLOWO2_01_FULL_43_14]
MKVAIVHDYLNQYGGAERVLEALHELWPDAPVYTSMYDRKLMKSYGFDDTGWDIRASFMQKIPMRASLPRSYLTFLYPQAFASFDLRGYDVIISSSSYASKNITKPSGSIHICYCHTPPRFLYGFDQETTLADMTWWEKLASRVFIPYLRSLDQQAAQAVDFFIANSVVVQKRIKMIYKKDALVIYPPVDTQRFEKKQQLSKEIDKPYFLVISRLGEYKRVDLVIEAFNKLGTPLKVIGTGPRLSHLKSLAQANIEFLGRLSDEETTAYLQNAEALIFPTEEDFGITPVEALAAGKAVIAYKGGGALETLDQKTALFFSPQTAQALVEAVKNFDPSLYNPYTSKKRASKFSRELFKTSLRKFVEDNLKSDEHK